MKYLLKIFLLLSIVGCVKKMDRVNPIDGKTLPLITTNPVTNFTSTSAVITGYINNNGGLPISSKGIVWSITPNAPSDLMSKIGNGVGEPSFTTSLSGLNPATKYYVRAFAVNLVGTAYGSEVTFTTKNDTPYVTTIIANPSFYNNTVTGGTVTAENGSPVTVRGLVYGLTQFPTTELSTIVNDSLKGPGTYVIKLTKLLPATTYYARAYARNSIGRSYGNQITIITPATTPTYITVPPTSQSTTATTGGTYVSNGGAAIIDKGVVWSTSPIASTTPITSILNKISKGPGDASFTATISGLTPGTLYYVYSYATNAAGTAFGTEEKFTTDPVTPTVNTGTIQTPGPTSVDISSVIVDDGGANITEFGYVYSINPTPSLLNGATKFVVGTTTGTDRKNISFFNTIKNLKPNTTYYVRAYATNSKALTGYGNDIMFKTASSIPVVVMNTPASFAITDVSAKLTASITDNGGANITRAGIYWSTSPGVTKNSSILVDQNVPQTTINITLDGLTSNKPYYVKAFATNTNGEALSSNEITFTTSDNSPKLSVTTATVNADNTVNVSAKIISQGLQTGAFITSKGFILGSSSTVNLATAITTSPSQGSGSGDIAYLFINLSPGTVYYARAYATNNNGGTYGYGDPATFKTNVVSPTVITYDPTSISSSGVTVKGEVTNEGGDPVIDAGFVWGVSATNLTLGNSGTKGTGLGTFSFTIPFTNLTRGATYYYKAYAKNGVKPIVYGDFKTFKVP
jgi:hypothetical protein